MNKFLKIIWKGINNSCDYITIALGVITLIFTIINQIDKTIFIFNYEIDVTALSEYFTYASGLVGLIYILYPTYLWFIRRAEFDWQLINGHFLRKVISLVLLMPFTLVSIYFLISNFLGLSHCELYTENTNLNQESSIFWVIYYHFIDPGNQHMASTSIGRTFVGVISILGVLLLNGLLVSSILGWIDKRKEEWMSGNIKRYKPSHLGKNKFAIVIGANEVASSVIRSLFTPKKKGEINYKCETYNNYVILQTNRNIEDVRFELTAHLTEDQLKRVIIYKANRDSVIELKYLNIEYSSEIYILGESTLVDGGETFHDAMNMCCVNLIANELEELREKRYGKIKYILKWICNKFDKSQESKQHTTTNSIEESDRNCYTKFFIDALTNLNNKISKPRKKICKVMFEYQTTSSIFQFSDVADKIKKHIVFIPFNRYESWAKAVIADNKAEKETNPNTEERYTPLDGKDGIHEDSKNHVHFVIVGMSKMGIAMGIQAMQQAHYINYAKAEKEANEDLKNARRTRITFIDTNADKEMAFFKGRYENLFNLTRHRYIDADKCTIDVFKADSLSYWTDPMKTDKKWNHLSNGTGNFIDIEIEFIKGAIETENIRTYLRNISDKNNPWVENSNLTIAICLTQTHQAVAASLYMPIPVYEKVQEIWVYQRESADIILNLTSTSTKDKRYKKLKPFGMLYSEYMSYRSQYLKALLVNGAYDLDSEKIKAIDRDLSKKETFSDLRESWKSLSIDKKFSNRYYVDSIPLKIRSIRGEGLPYDKLKTKIDEYSELLAISEHNRWNIQQLLFGYSPCNKDDDEKFKNLNSEYKKAKDELKEWKEEKGYDNLSKEEQKIIREKLPKENVFTREDNTKNEFNKLKKEYKEGENRKHANICAYNHLDVVDFGAKSYDTKINSIIPIIKLLVDDKIESKTKNN